MDKGNIELKPSFSSNYLFLSNSLTKVVFNSRKTPKRTKQSLSLLKSQKNYMSCICWTLFLAFQSGMQELTTMLHPFLGLRTSILGEMVVSFFLR
jgi:hypothetical protein